MDEVLLSKLRNGGKKLSVIRTGGACFDSDAPVRRRLSGRVDILNVSAAAWVSVGEHGHLLSARESMRAPCSTGACTSLVNSDLALNVCFLNVCVLYVILNSV